MTPAAPRIDWQPIKTAPEDGTRVLLFRPDTVPWVRVVFGRYDLDQYAKKPRPYWTHDCARLTGVAECRGSPPTHWAQVPEPPHD